MKGIKKTDLPEKLCIVCQRVFVWRKKWEKNWESVLYCSERCRKSKLKIINNV
ncbi:MAG: DUF2256 domain-containing protein [Flavobacteriia bacterium]|jgi:hypothetical protein